MDSDAASPPQDNAETKAEFRKLSNDAANRKYRRRSPASGSSSDGSPKRRRGSSPVEHRHRRKDDERDLEKDSGWHQSGRSRDSNRHADRPPSRNTHGYSRHDDSSRHEKHANDKDRHYRVSSHHERESRGAARSDHASEEGERNRNRDHTRNIDRSSHDNYDGPGYRTRDREKHTNSTSEDRERARYRRDRDGRDERKDYHRSLGDYKSDHSLYHEESRGYRNESSGRDKDGHRSRESYRNDEKELEVQKEKQDGRESNRDVDDYSRLRRERNDNKSVFTEHRDSLSKKLFESGSGMDHSRNESSTSVGDEKQSSNSKHAEEIDHETSVGQVQASSSDVTNDLNAAKVAAMKAAELVNRNLCGVGFMSTEQKKKLLWGNKKSTTSEETVPKWNTAMFGDRERQEKFNKLMGVKGDVKMDYNPEKPESGGHLESEKQKELQMDLEKQYTAGLRRRDGRTVGLGL